MRAFHSSARSRFAGLFASAHLPLAAIRPGLEAAGDLEEVTELVRATIARGTGAARQREAFQRTGSLESVVDLVIAETAR